MNISKLRIISIVALICISAVSCGGSNGSSSNSETSENIPISEEKDTVSHNHTEKFSEEKANSNSTETIIDTSFDSGYIQINDVLLKDGGYIIVKDFIDEYSDRFDVSMLEEDSEKEIDEDWFFTYYIYYGEEKYGIDVSCAPPPSGSGTVKDAVIVKFSPQMGKADDVDHEVWYPHGICKYLSEKENIDYMKKLFEDNGLTYTEIDEEKAQNKSLGLEDKFPIRDNCWKYIIINNESSTGIITNMIGAFQLSEPNLYGFKPVISCSYTSGQSNSFRYFEVDYKEDSRYIQW